jgi:hypothetical protein
VKFYWPFAKTAFFLRLSLDVAIRFRNASNDCKDKSEAVDLIPCSTIGTRVEDGLRHDCRHRRSHD